MMLKAAPKWVDRRTSNNALEHLTAIKRAGADMILTYLAHEVAETLLVTATLFTFCFLLLLK